MNKLNTTIAVLSVGWALAICAERSEKSKALHGTSGKNSETRAYVRTPNTWLRSWPFTKYDASTPDRFRWKFSVIVLLSCLSCSP